MAVQSCYLCLALFTLLLLGGAEAASSFKPNCTLPAEGTNFVYNPNTRGTLSILWECILLTVLCTWSILHLNVPVIHPEPTGWLQQQWWLIQDALHKLKWMILTILLPEIMMGKAATDLLAAISACKTNSRIAPNLPQAHLTNMGYFVLDTQDSVQEHSEDQVPSPMPPPVLETFDGVRDQTWSEVRYDESLDATLDDTGLYSRDLMRRYWVLDFEQWQQLSSLEPNLIEFPQLTFSQRGQLEGQGAVLKFLALIQLLYLIVQLIARKHKSLPSSQLEIMALAFASCSILTFFLCWFRSQNVQSICTIKPTRRISRDAMRAIVHWVPEAVFRPDVLFYKEVGPKPLSNDSLRSAPAFVDGFWDAPFTLLNGTVAIGGALFGGLHCLAWNFEFPTHFEMVAWRLCSIATAAVPVAFFLLSFTLFHLKGFNSKVILWLGLVSLIVLGATYTVSRLYLVIESVRTLFFLPPQAYVATWAGNLPH